MLPRLVCLLASLATLSAGAAFAEEAPPLPDAADAAPAAAEAAPVATPAPAVVLEHSAPESSASPLEPGRGVPPPVEVNYPFVLTAYFDLLSTWNKTAADSSSETFIRITEIGFSSQLLPKLSINFDLVYAKDAGVDLGFANIEWKPFSAEEGHHTARMALVLGKLDVPFGLDWRFLASFSRRFVSPPLAVELAGTNFNSQGADLYGRLFDGRLYYCAWVVNGRSLVVNPAEPDPTLHVSRDGGVAFGGRFSVRGHGLPELGINGAFEYPKGLGLQQTLVDVDLRWAHTLLSDDDEISLRGELIYQRWMETDPATLDTDSLARSRMERYGGYAQLGYQYAEVFGAVRFSTIGSDALRYQKQYSGVLGYVLLENHLEARLEYTRIIARESSNNVYLQLVGQI